jgi:hypothetical protein
MSSAPGNGPLPGSCEHSNQSSSYIKDGLLVEIMTVSFEEELYHVEPVSRNAGLCDILLTF